MNQVIFKQDSANPLRVELSVWNGKHRIDVRKMFYNRDGELFPTKNGLGLDIYDGTAQAVLDAMLIVNGTPVSVMDAYGVVTVERREYKGHPLLDVRRFYKGKPSLHGFSLTEDIEREVIQAIATLLGIEIPAEKPASAAVVEQAPTKNGDGRD